MGARLFAPLSRGASSSKVKHYLGAPPELTGGVDTRREMGQAVFLLIEDTPDGFFLYRYDADGACVGDTWHKDVEDAKSQAAYEFECRLVQGWEEMPALTQDAIAYCLARIEKS